MHNLAQEVSGARPENAFRLVANVLQDSGCRSDRVDASRGLPHVHRCSFGVVSFPGLGHVGDQFVAIFYDVLLSTVPFPDEPVAVNPSSYALGPGSVSRLVVQLSERSVLAIAQ